MSGISKVNAIQVFDSRGIPTISCKITLDCGASASAMVPSGASTGSKEAIELRDNGVNYHGKGVLTAVSNINEKLAPLLIGIDPSHQAEIDKMLINFDGTEDKSNVGANAILAISWLLLMLQLKKKISHFTNISQICIKK